jgi:hypothetical protein
MKHMNMLATSCILLITGFDVVNSFLTPKLTSRDINIQRRHALARGGPALASYRRSNNEDKFSPQQRIESVKTGVLGAISGGMHYLSCLFIQSILYLSCISIQ